MISVNIYACGQYSCIVKLNTFLLLINMLIGLLVLISAKFFYVDVMLDFYYVMASLMDGFFLFFFFLLCTYAS